MNKSLSRCRQLGFPACAALALWAVIALATAAWLLVAPEPSRRFQIVSEEQSLLIRAEAPPDFFAVAALAISISKGLLPWFWALPVVFWLGCRFPLAGAPWLLHLALHFAAALALSLGAESFLRRPSALTEEREMKVHLELKGEPRSGALLPPLPADPPFALHAVDVFAFLRRRSDMAIYGIVLGVANAVLQHRRARERERRALELEKSLASAKLHALRMQLHPHFLFNTLHAISSLVRSNPAAADEMINSLSEFLRLSLDAGEAQEIPLRQELEFLDRYLAIQQTRFGGRLQIERRIDPESLDCLVPSLFLQPIAENALKHGIEPETEGGCVAIETLRNNGLLRVQVADNGPGFPEIPLRESDEGVGLANTRLRLRELHGGNASLILAANPSGGALVTVELPARPA